MARGIIIFGPAGSGKTTLGRMTAESLQYPYFDLDDYIWRKDTAIPYTQMYSREEKIGRLMSDISHGSHFVMAGSMSSFHVPFDPLFDLAVYLTASTETRLARLHQRELSAFGSRILPGGDMYEEHQQFLDGASRYETDGSPSRSGHEQWAAVLPCRLLRLSGEDAPEKNAEIILAEYARCISAIAKMGKEETEPSEKSE